MPRKTRRKKKNRKVVLPIHPEFAAWLKKQTRDIGKAPVFPTLAGKSGGGKSGLSMQFKRIMERAGIQGRILRERNGEGRSQSSLSFHSLRHSFNSALANRTPLPDGRDSRTYLARLAELEAQAKAARRGVWGKATP